MFTLIHFPQYFFRKSDNFNRIFRCPEYWVLIGIHTQESH